MMVIPYWHYHLHTLNWLQAGITAALWLVFVELAAWLQPVIPSPSLRLPISSAELPY